MGWGPARSGEWLPGWACRCPLPQRRQPGIGPAEPTSPAPRSHKPHHNHAPPPAGYELLRYAASVHCLAPPPDALLVDDLHLLAADLAASHGGHDARPRPRDMALCRLLATLHEAAVRGTGAGAGGCLLGLCGGVHN